MAGFNATNNPETCIYCGKKLYYKHRKATSYSQTITLCCQAPIDWVHPWKQQLDGSYGPEKTCSNCHRPITGVDDTEEQVIDTPAWRAEKPGAYQDGYFCTMACGWRFGQLAASKGVRYVKRPEGAADKEAERE